MNSMNNLYDDQENKKKFRLTRGMLILGIAILIAIVVIIIIIINIVKGSAPEYTTADFNKLERRMVEEAPIYLSQKNIELTSEEMKIELKDLLVKNGGSIDSDKIIAAKVCDGYVIAKKDNNETYNAYIKCKDMYTTSGYVSNEVTSTKKTVANVKDTTKPDISLIGDEEITISIGSKYNDQGARAKDNIDGDITAKIKVSGSVDTSKAGTYKMIYSVIDAAGNETSITRKVTVVQNNSNVTTTTKKNESSPVTTTKGTTTRKRPTVIPTITLYGSKTISINVGNTYYDPGYSAYDFNGNDLTSRVRVSSYVNTNAPGTYSVNYSVTDNYGNSASATRTVIVKSTYITLSGISISPNSIILDVGGNTKLNVYFNPTNATNKNVSWSSSNPSVATVSSGTIYAAARGTAIITVTGADGKSASARITVK